jgi:hypothetical protein
MRHFELYTESGINAGKHAQGPFFHGENSSLKIKILHG